MTNIRLFFDKRAPRRDGTCPLKIALYHNFKTVYYPIDIFLLPNQWDDCYQQVVERPDKKFLNVAIKKRFAECTIALSRILLRDDLDKFNAKQLLRMVLRGTDTADTPEDADYLIPVYNEYITLCRKTSTAATYRASLRNLIEYEKNIDTFRFKDISVAWLRKYQKWLTDERGMEVNGANVYMRNLRTIFNFAIQNKYTQARYPFRDIDMTTTETDKRYIPWDTFIKWCWEPMSDGREFYRDIFILSYCLCGIRPYDLLHVKKSQVVDGRLVYWPEKLNGRTKLSIKIEPEAQAIIDKYAGREYLLNIMESRLDYKSFMQHWNRALKAVGTDEAYEKKRGKRTYICVRHIGYVPYITAYYARQSWASFAYNLLDIPMDVISQALGHKSGLKVTNIYVKRDMAKVDAANRRMIDRLFGDMEKYAEKKKQSFTKSEG